MQTGPTFRPHYKQVARRLCHAFKVPVTMVSAVAPEATLIETLGNLRVQKPVLFLCCLSRPNLSLQVEHKHHDPAHDKHRLLGLLGLLSKQECALVYCATKPRVREVIVSISPLSLPLPLACALSRCHAALPPLTTPLTPCCYPSLPLPSPLCVALGRRGYNKASNCVKRVLLSRTRILTFCTWQVKMFLEMHHVPASAFHADLSTNEKAAALRDWRDGTKPVGPHQAFAAG